MKNWLYSIAKGFWPELEDMSERARIAGIGEVITFVVMIPLALSGLIWLVLLTDIDTIWDDLLALVLFGVMIFIFRRVNYFFIVEIRDDRYGSADGSLQGMIVWTSLFLLGPVALWLPVIGSVLNFGLNWQRATTTATRWSMKRDFSMEMAVITLGYLVGFSVYERLGGVYPIPGLSPQTLLPGLVAIVVNFLVVLLVSSGYIAYTIYAQRLVSQPDGLKSIFRFLVLAFGLPFLADPFGVLTAGIYVEFGALIFLYTLLGLLLVAYLTRQLSWAAESSRQQSRQLEQLERLSRQIINSPPTVSSLSTLLEEHVPMMFPSGRIAVWLEPNRYLYKRPGDWLFEIDSLWNWLRANDGPNAFKADEELPWDEGDREDHPIVTTPIIDVESVQPIGCIYIELRSLSQPWDKKALRTLFPAVQSLAALIASALHQVEVYEASLDFQATLQELEFAGRIQASFMPHEMPSLNGWEIAVTLLPARETAGDFFDFIPLSGDRLGVLIADVADKGVGAALYMALSRTLIRTYALEFDAQPEIVLFSANERILQDARANLFVTSFYGILDQSTGILTYSNAGHNPPFLINSKDGGTIHALTATGMPLGIDEDAAWEQNSILIEPGDLLLLYTDGIPDALNHEGQSFKERRLIEAAQASLHSPAHEMQATILNQIQQFVGDTPQFDDITLMLLNRNDQGGDHTKGVLNDDDFQLLS